MVVNASNFFLKQTALCSAPKWAQDEELWMIVESKFNTRFENLKGIGFKSSTVPIYVTPGLVLSHKRSFFLSIEKAATQNPPLKNNTRGDQRTVACPKNDLSSKLWSFKFDHYQYYICKYVLEFTNSSKYQGFYAHIPLKIFKYHIWK